MKIHPALQDFDPREFGFMSGLEVHHQLLTEKKLFCRCPSGRYTDEYHAQVLRHMRPTLSELGEYDGTALMEFKTHKEIIYRMNKESVCTYEMDDNPPFLINRQAVDIAIEIALMLNCSIVSELHVARKQYLDGSIPAGFQRTAIVGVNGRIPYKDREIGIIQLAIEEDSCREISDIGHQRIYATDRLNMPLIEVVTAPDMKDPQEVYEVGKLIGHILRTTGKVRRGIGSVRQDVNVSVKGGTRIEIKGVPRIPLFPELTFYEAYRQHKLLAIREELNKRGIKSEVDVESHRVDLTNTFQPMPPHAPSDVYRVGAIVLKGLRGILSTKIGGDRTFADDIAGRVRVIACLMQQPIILHTDSDTVTSLTDNGLEKVKQNSGMGADDCTVVVWGDKDDVETALNEIEIRIKEATVGIPQETRRALSTGETDFERILPGPDRMYPDTDSPPLAFKDEEIEKIRAILKERPWERRKRLKDLRLSDHLVDQLIISPHIDLFDKLTSEFKVEPVLTAYVLGELTVHYQRENPKAEKLTSTDLEQLFAIHLEGCLNREAFRPILEKSAQDDNRDWLVVLKELEMKPGMKEQIEPAVDKAIEDNQDAEFASKENKMQFLMGETMRGLHFQASGHKVLQVLEQKLM